MSSPQKFTVDAPPTVTLSWSADGKKVRPLTSGIAGEKVRVQFLTASNDDLATAHEHPLSTDGTFQCEEDSMLGNIALDRVSVAYIGNNGEVGITASASALPPVAEPTPVPTESITNSVPVTPEVEVVAPAPAATEAPAEDPTPVIEEPIVEPVPTDPVPTEPAPSEPVPAPTDPNQSIEPEGTAILRDDTVIVTE